MMKQPYQVKVTYVAEKSQEELIRKVEYLLTQGWEVDGNSRFQFGLHRQSLIKKIGTINELIVDRIQTIEVRMS